MGNIIKLYNKNNSIETLQTIADTLNDGGIIIYPTDTMYAMGCHALKERPIERICKLKKIDPRKHHLSIICYDLSNISEYAKVSNTTFKLMKRNLPGPFTFLLETSSRMPDKALEKRHTIGIRIPDNSIPRAIVERLGVPMLTSSVLDDEEVEYLTDPELIEERYGRDVDLVIDGGMGDTVPTTVVDLTDEDPVVLRDGKGELQL